jgi:tetratricopeptide (TPR) repeat protein
VRPAVLRAVLVLSLLIATLAGAALASESAAERILGRATEAENDPDRLRDLLAEIEGEIAAHPADASAHYTRAWILSHVGRDEDAVAEYAEASRLDPTLADAHYNAGCVLADLGRVDEALRQWTLAVEADSNHVDALYNAAQYRYNRKEYADALALWSRAMRLTPGDFGTAKKVLQAENALGEWGAAAEARKVVFELWRTSEDAKVRGLKQYCFDQFDVAGTHVYAYETFEPSGEKYQLYAFRVTEAETTIATVALESSPDLRRQGNAYGLTATGRMVALETPVSFAELPRYEALRPMVVKLIETHLQRPTSVKE